MFVFFSFYMTRDSRHQFQRKRPGGGKIYRLHTHIRTAAVDDRWQHLHALVQQQHFLPIKKGKKSHAERIYDEDFIFHSTLRRWRKWRDAIIHRTNLKKKKKKGKLVSFFFFNFVVRKKKLLRETSEKEKFVTKITWIRRGNAATLRLCSFDGVVATIYD